MQDLERAKRQQRDARNMEKIQRNLDLKVFKGK